MRDVLGLTLSQALWRCSGFILNQSCFRCCMKEKENSTHSEPASSLLLPQLN